jgi:hypothetical protein
LVLAVAAVAQILAEVVVVIQYLAPLLQTEAVAVRQMLLLLAVVLAVAVQIAT